MQVILTIFTFHLILQDSVGDNTTPESSSRVGVVRDDEEVKRSLDKVYDLDDDDASESTTKAAKKSPEIPLLVPKVEKQEQ